MGKFHLPVCTALIIYIYIYCSHIFSGMAILLQNRYMLYKLVVFMECCTRNTIVGFIYTLQVMYCGKLLFIVGFQLGNNISLLTA